jgi:hypothetical protein
MKTQDSWAVILKVAGATIFVSGLLLLGVLQGRAKRTHPTGAGQSPVPAIATANHPQAKSNLEWRERYGKLPLSFEENLGQTAKEVRFVSHGNGFGLFLTPQEAVISLQQSMPKNLSPLHRTAYFRAFRKVRQAGRMSVLRMRLEGANLAAQITGGDLLPGKVNYFIGNNPKDWRTDVPSYGRVKYAGIYPGVDLVFYGNQHRLEYDFVVAPGADPKAIELSLKGAQKLWINSKGDLILSISGGQVALQKPVIYQIVKGDRRAIQGSYLVARNQSVSFAISDYDKSAPLIIDPVLNYSTYLGGSAAPNGDLGSGIAVDSLGDAFVTGTTFSTTFPSTPGGFGAGNAFGVAFVTEVNPTGTALLYTTYLGGTGGDFGMGIALDNSGNNANPGGNIYVTGGTFSTDFPTTAANALKPGPNPGASGGTSFVSKINPSASGIASLVYSSYLGGTNGTSSDYGNAVAADVSGNAYVTGFTASSPGSGLANFPVTAASAFQTVLGSSNGNAFLTRIDTTKAGSASLAYSTYLGGSGLNAVSSGLGYGEVGFGVAADTSENAYIVGQTTSTDFPTTNATAYQPNTAPPAAVANGTVFVSRIDASTTPTPSASLVYSTYLGGENIEFGTAIALKPNSAVAYITGTTDSLQFPTFAPAAPGPYQTVGSTGGSAFVSVLDTGQVKAASLTYSTFLGGASTTGFGIAADAAGNAYIGGGTNTSNYPVTPGAFQPAFAPAAQGEGIISKLNPGGNGAADLVYSTFFGGSGVTGEPDSVDAIAIDSQNNAYVTGVTFSSSATFPVFPPATAATPAFQTSLPAGDLSAAFVAKLTLIPRVVVTPSPFDFGVQPLGIPSNAQTFTLTNNTNSIITFSSIAVTGLLPAANSDFVLTADMCSPSVAAGAQCTVSVTFTPSTSAAESATLAFTDSDISSPQNVSLTGTGSATAPGVGFDHASVPFGGVMLTTTSSATNVKLTNTGVGALTITSIAVSGDFAATGTGASACPISPATLAAGANCIISVTFAPTVVGARTGALTVTDNANGSPQSIPLSGTGWDFNLTGPSSQQTVSPSAPLKFNVTMTPLGGFNQGVGLSCAIVPTANTMCTVVTPVMATDGMTAQVAQVSVTTTALMVPPRSVPYPPVSMRQIVPLILALMLLLLIRRTQRIRLRVGMVAAMLMLVVLAGCSGGLGKPITPPTQAVITITGTSNGLAGAVTHTATVALTVN